MRLTARGLGMGRKWLLAAVGVTAMAGLGRTQAPPPTGSATAGTGEAGVWEASAVKMEFDVASVKENKSGDMPNSNIPMGPGTVYVPNGGNFIATSMPLISYILFAYKMGPGTAHAMEEQVPGWVMTERYDITAKTDKHDETKDEMRLMMRSLLAERFKLVVRSETQQVPVYGLVLAKPGTLGPKLVVHRTSEPCGPLGDNERPTDTVAGGFLRICDEIVSLPNSTRGMTTMGARNVPIGQLVGVLAGFGNLGRPVLDQTRVARTFQAPPLGLLPLFASRVAKESWQSIWTILTRLRAIVLEFGVSCD